MDIYDIILVDGYKLDISAEDIKITDTSYEFYIENKLIGYLEKKVVLGYFISSNMSICKI